MKRLQYNLHSTVFSINIHTCTDIVEIRDYNRDAKIFLEFLYVNIK